MLGIKRQVHFKVLLVGDTHPEMVAIARELAQRNIDFKIVLPTYFTDSESKFISLFLLKGLELNSWVKKRTLDSRIKSKFIIRKYAILESLSWIFKRRGYNSISWKLARNYNLKISIALPKLVDLYKPSVVVTYDTINVTKFDNAKHVVICPMTHPNVVANDLAEAKAFSPDWPEMVDEEPLGIAETAKNANRIIVLSEYAKQSYTYHGFENSKLKVIPIGPINGNSEISHRLKRDSGVLRILFLGRMTQIKGIETMAQLSHLVNARLVQISLVGLCPPNIATYIRSISNPKVLTLIENPSPDELSRYFLNSDIFVSPSFNEGFGISSIEAMSYGLIPVLSRKTGVSEILIGTLLEKLIFDSGNVEQLALCIEYLHNLNTEEFNNLSDISYQIAKNYSFDRFANEFVEFVTQEI